MKKRRVVAILIVLVVAVSCLVLCLHNNRYKVPSLKGDQYIYDQAGMVSKEDESFINGHLKELARKTEATLFVVTVKCPSKMSLEEYATKIFDEWGLEKLSTLSEYENVVLVFDKKTKDVAIKVTFGLNDSFSDKRFRAIRYNCFEPYLAEKDYSKAVKATSFAVLYSIADEYDVDITYLHITSPYGNSFVELVIIFGGLLVCLSFLIFLLNKSKTKD